MTSVHLHHQEFSFHCPLDNIRKSTQPVRYGQTIPEYRDIYGD